jgi:hypothetical protein
VSDVGVDADHTDAGAAAMNIHSTDRASVAADQMTALRRMTTEQLRHLGTDQVVYVRRARRDSEQVLVLYGADGTPLSAVETADAAFELAADHGLAFVTVH